MLKLKASDSFKHTSNSTHLKTTLGCWWGIYHLLFHYLECSRQVNLAVLSLSLMVFSLLLIMIITCLKLITHKSFNQLHSFEDHFLLLVRDGFARECKCNRNSIIVLQWLLGRGCQFRRSRR